MGYSATGILAFGIDLGEENPLYNEETDEEIYFEDLLVKRAGLVDPYEPLPDGMEDIVVMKSYGGRQEYEDHHATHLARKEAFPVWALQVDNYYAERSRLVKECPIEIETYGAYEYGCHIIAVNESVITGDWGYTVRIDPLSLRVTTEQVQAAARFCEELGFPPFENPGWILTARYS